MFASNACRSASLQGPNGLETPTRLCEKGLEASRHCVGLDREDPGSKDVALALLQKRRVSCFVQDLAIDLGLKGAETHMTHGSLSI